ncbi:hypothetical protein ACHAXR_010296 [Thalassiosira sp. AJA248-18]
MAPPSRRRILPSQTLAKFDAAHLYPSLNASAMQSQPSASAVSKPSTISPPPEVLPNGIEIGGWKITTQNSAIGDEKRMEELTVLLEETANTDDNGNSNTGEGTNRRKRRLCPPEITFLDAIISFQCQSEKNKSSSDALENSGDITTGIRFTARDALMEWAEAHRYLEMKQDQTQSSLPSRGDEFRGVSILTTVDAKIWSDRQQNIDAAIATSGNSDFQYDWTFSSPYAGTIQHYSHIDNTPDNIAGKDGIINNRRQWQPLKKSHIPFHLLQDTSQPILLFDDIHLYEDDLHDNGDVSLNIKIRVMPRCWYVLQRLFVRVDYVCVKCREVRYFCLFEDSVSNENDVRANAIYRDIVWREATWDELDRLALPVDPAAWREGGNAGGAAPGMPTLPPLASLLTRLPLVEIPYDLSRFSCFDVFSEQTTA